MVLPGVRPIGHVSFGQLKVMCAIESCRTAGLAACGALRRPQYTQIAYNSCRNRHRPKCQGTAAREWLAARGRVAACALLPCRLHPAGGDRRHRLAEQAGDLHLLFKASSETLLRIAADPKHLGARIAITSVLHTWGSAMTHHPHVHMIVPGGGISLDGERWIGRKPSFFLPVRVLSKLFRRLMIEKLEPRRTRPASSPSSATHAGLADAKRSPPSWRPCAGPVVRLQQASVRRSQGGAGLSCPLHSPRRHLQPPPDRSTTTASPSRSRTTGSKARAAIRP